MMKLMVKGNQSLLTTEKYLTGTTAFSSVFEMVSESGLVYG